MTATPRAQDTTAPVRGEADLRTARTLRLVLLIGAATSAALAAVLAVALPEAERLWPASVCLALAATLVLLVLRPSAMGAVPTLTATVAATLMATVVLALSLRAGVSFVGLAFIPLLLFAAALMLPQRVTLALALLHLLALLALAGADLQRLAAGSGTLLAVLRDTSMQVALLVVAVAFGLIADRNFRRTVGLAALRERRFMGLLAVAADWYWEMDSELRFTYVSEQASSGSALASARRIGRRPWEIEDFGLDPLAMDAHHADLEARQPFADLLVHRTDSKGRERWLTVSGKPRFDERGLFIGYWGVGRDVTAEHEAELARAATEARYRELFARSPSALVLHRDGRVLMANDAALALLGVSRTDDLVGRTLLDFYDDRDGSRERAAGRSAWLDDLPVGDGVPPLDFLMRNAAGRGLRVLVSSVKVEADGRPAILSIYLDQTQRLRTEAARARSEALLSHVVATSPDLITLTDLSSGRYVMVNDAFCQQVGYTRAEAIGRTSIELGVWGDARERAQFVSDVQAEGQVRDRAIVFRGRDDRRFTLLVSAARFAMEGRDYLVLNGRDVTQLERERLEREAILENASIGIAMTRDRMFQLANPRFEQMFGWPPGSLVGQPGHVISVDQNDYDSLGQQYGPSLTRGEAVEFERVMRRHDGSTFLCRLLARPIDPSHPSKGGTIWIAEDVTERHAVQQALARARDEAEAASQAKSAFLANTSHEIRTPLNGLVGLARMARQPGLDEDRRAAYLRQIDDSAQALSGVISDILDLSKIEAGKLRLESVDFDLHALLESIEHGYSALAEARALTLQMSVASNVPRRVRGDPVRVRQVLTNYLANAVKFTEQGGVRVAVRRGAGALMRFEVEDSGPGIEPAALERLFQPFMQADVSTTRRYGGTGLGLSICRELADLMGGQVGVRSELGRGCLFWAELPLPTSDVSGPDSALGGLDDDERSLTGLRVLMVEDNPVNMMIAVALLEQWGVEVSQAGNGADAVAMVRAEVDAGRAFDIVLMDVQMPVLGGHDATRELRQRFDARALPIIALTAAALTSERDEALAVGMNDFLTKPIDAQRLHDTLLRWRGVGAC